MMFQSALLSLPPHHLVLTSEKRKASAKDILDIIPHIRSSLINYSRVSLKIRDSYHLALSLLALDSYLDTIFLHPTELKTEDLQALFNEHEIDFTIDDEFITECIEKSSTSENPTICAPPKKETNWILLTSGTSGKPKAINHSLRSLTSSSQTDTSIGKDIRWGLLYDITRFAGLQVFLQSVLGGSTLIIPNRDSINQSVQFLKDHNCNAISATPSLWKKIVMSPYHKTLDLKLVILGGEIADQGILSVHKASFPNAKIKHIYASTEAGVGFSVSDCREGFPQTYLTSPPNGIQLKVDSNGTLHIKPRFAISSPSSDLAQLIDSNGFINTMDVVEKKEDRYIFLGRLSGVINIGGQKVFPEKVERVLQTFPGVEMALVKPKKSAFMGSLIEADIQISNSDETDTIKFKKDLLLYCKDKLENYEVPCIINIVRLLPIQRTGKLKRNKG